MAAVLCAARGYDVVELNASDTRSARTVEETLGDALGCQVVSSSFAKKGAAPPSKKRLRRVVIMDEIDGLSGSDRGGSQALVKLIKSSSTPIICICNARQSAKVKTLANHCFDLRFKRPMKVTIAKRVVAIATKEGLTIEQNAAELLVESCGNDIRQCLNALQMWATSEGDAETCSYTAMKDRLSTISKDAIQRVTPFDGAKIILSDVRRKSHFDRCDAFFTDYSLVPLLVQHNYVTAASAARDAQGKPCSVDEKLHRLEAAAACLSDVDLIDRRVHADQEWGLLTTEASLTVRAGVLVDGSCMAPQFSAWFGKNSTTKKSKRQCGELALHLGSRISGTRDAVRRDYLPMLAKYVTRPLVDGGAAGVAETIARLDEYGLSKDDLFETLPDLQLGGAKVPGLDALDTKAKTHFTKTYNAGTHGSQALQPQNLVAKKKKRKADDDAPGVARDDDDYLDDDDDEEDLDVSMFSKKKKKAPAKKAPAARKPAAKKSKKG